MHAHLSGPVAHFANFGLLKSQSGLVVIVNELGNKENTRTVSMAVFELISRWIFMFKIL